MVVDDSVHSRLTDLTNGVCVMELREEEYPQVENHLKLAMLRAYAVTGVVTSAAKAAGIHPGTHYGWCKRDAKYKEAAGGAYQQAMDRFEDEATRRALDGVEEVVLYKGEPVMVDGKVLKRVRHSDALLQFMLKAGRPDKYAERKQVEQNTTVKGRLTVEEMTDEQLAARVKHLMDNVKRVSEG